MASVVRENIGELHDKITVTLSKDDYMPAFEKGLKDFAKKANVPGFRKGMVPAGIIKKMHGNELFADQVLKLAEKELNDYLVKENPEIFGQPLPYGELAANLDMNNPGDYNFDFEIGLKPEMKVSDISKENFTWHGVEVTDSMVDEELNRMQIKGGEMTEPELIDNDDNVINFTLTETENGTAKEDGIKKENSVLLKYFSPALQKQLRGKKVGDAVEFSLGEAFEGDKLDMMAKDLGLDAKDAATAGKTFSLAIDKIGLVNKRELDEAFFNEIYPNQEVKTEEELRGKLRTEIEQFWAMQSRNQLHDQIYHNLLDKSEIKLPEGFLKRWLEVAGEKRKSKEEAEKEYPGFAQQLKWMLISDKLMAENEINVGQEELRASMREEIMRYFGNMDMAGGDTSWLDSYIDRMMQDKQQVDNTYRRLAANKMFAALETKVKPGNKTVKSEELLAMQHNHSH